MSKNEQEIDIDAVMSELTDDNLCLIRQALEYYKTRIANYDEFKNESFENHVSYYELKMIKNHRNRKSKRFKEVI